jgi:hypothetical protein
VVASHTRATPSQVAATMRVPSVLNAAVTMPPLYPFSFRISLPLATSRMRGAPRAPSSTTRRAPSGLSAKSHPILA